MKGLNRKYYEEMNRNIKLFCKEPQTDNKQKTNFLKFNYRKKFEKIDKIFMTKRGEDIVNADRNELMEKRSVTVDNVYSYLKGMSNSNLVKIYNDRKNVINDICSINNSTINDQIMYTSCSNTIMQTQLMLNA